MTTTATQNGLAHPTSLDLELNGDVSDVHVSSSGNMSFEVLVNEQLSPRTPGSLKSPLAKKVHSPRRELTYDDIESKLKAAEQRRAAQEQAKRDQAAAEQEKIEKANARRDELENSFKNEVEKGMEEKLEANKENREKMQAARAEKAKQETEKCRAVREQREQYLEQVIKQLAEKVEEEQLQTEELQKQKLEELQEKLQKEFDYVEASRLVLDRKDGKADADKWQAKLDAATQRRDLLLEAIKHRQNEHAAPKAKRKSVLSALNRSSASGDSSSTTGNKNCSLQ